MGSVGIQPQMRQAPSLAASLPQEAACRAVGTAGVVAPSLVTHVRIKLCVRIAPSRPATSSHSNRKLENVLLPAVGGSYRLNRSASAELLYGSYRTTLRKLDMLKLTFFPNSQNVWIGELLRDETRLLATSHPATIAAAIFAMDEYSVRVETEKGSFDIDFPLDMAELPSWLPIMLDAEMAQWMCSLYTFSQFDFVNPHPMDTQADIHFRTAIHHLPPELVKVRPTEAERKGFKKELKKRNRFIYYPWC